jgi:hypothetical protein
MSRLALGGYSSYSTTAQGYDTFHGPSSAVTNVPRDQTGKQIPLDEDGPLYGLAFFPFGQSLDRRMSRESLLPLTSPYPSFDSSFL